MLSWLLHSGERPFLKHQRALAERDHGGSFAAAFLQRERRTSSIGDLQQLHPPTTVSFIQIIRKPNGCSCPALGLRPWLLVLTPVSQCTLRSHNG